MGAALLGVLVLGAAGVFIVAAYRRRWHWTGLPADPSGAAEPPRPAKTLWDWLQLLVVPLVLALAAYGLNATQASRDRQREDRQAARDRATAEDAAQEDTLRTYLQQMSGLITDHGLRPAPMFHSDGAAADQGVSTLARTLTLIALRRLDAERKSLVVQFLSEAGLIRATVKWNRTRRGFRLDPTNALGIEGGRVSLKGADLRGVRLRGTTTYESRVSPRHVLISSPNLDEADLRNADFRGLPLFGVSLRGADLRGADFRGANLDGTVFTASCLSGARFARAAVTSSITGVALADFTYTDGRDVDFSHARLDGADFEAATLRGVTLRGASTAHVRWPAGWTATGARASPPTGLRPCERVAERDEPG